MLLEKLAVADNNLVHFNLSIYFAVLFICLENLRDVHDNRDISDLLWILLCNKNSSEMDRNQAAR